MLQRIYILRIRSIRNNTYSIVYRLRSRTATVCGRLITVGAQSNHRADGTSPNSSCDTQQLPSIHKWSGACGVGRVAATKRQRQTWFLFVIFISSPYLLVLSCCARSSEVVSFISFYLIIVISIGTLRRFLSCELFTLTNLLVFKFTHHLALIHRVTETRFKSV